MSQWNKFNENTFDMACFNLCAWKTLANDDALFPSVKPSRYCCFGIYFWPVCFYKTERIEWDGGWEIDRETTIEPNEIVIQTGIFIGRCWNVRVKQYENKSIKKSYFIAWLNDSTELKRMTNTFQATSAFMKMLVDRMEI